MAKLFKFLLELLFDTYSLFKHIICFSVIFIVVFVGVSFFYGGDSYRWVGVRAQEAGTYIKELSETVADASDRIENSREFFADLFDKVGGFLGYDKSVKPKKEETSDPEISNEERSADKEPSKSLKEETSQ
ncbi:hypothetical protein MCHI_000495 [Candidatus Magnetoovum chiemensis]|nr:hypothetical protein MCHI_000495 [Candidatus Magnetoovum chiemensis]